MSLVHHHSFYGRLLSVILGFQQAVLFSFEKPQELKLLTIGASSHFSSELHRMQQSLPDLAQAVDRPTDILTAAIITFRMTMGCLPLT